jgi:hypothetical protein
MCTGCRRPFESGEEVLEKDHSKFHRKCAEIYVAQKRFLVQFRRWPDDRETSLLVAGIERTGSAPSLDWDVSKNEMLKLFPETQVS